MTFFVRKRLALGPIRFGVSPRQRVEAIDDDPAFSTGAGGEFMRRGAAGGFFFGDLFVLLGFSVVARKGPQGWIEVILGLGMIAAPIILTAQERKALREKEE